MFERIVAIVDDSAASQYAVDAGIAVAREDGGELLFCVTVDPTIDDNGVGGSVLTALADTLSSDLVEKAVQRARDAGLSRVSGRVLSGEEVAGICSFALAQRADLIVIGVEPRARALRPFFHSLAESVLRETTIPLCVVRRPSSGDFRRRILVPVVDDPVSRAGVAYAVSLAKHFAATVLFCTIVDAKAETAGTAALQRAQNDASAGGVASEALLVPQGGDVSAAIVRNADVHRCDCIVIASHVREGWPRFVEGSVTEAVFYASTVPVVIVRTTR